MRTFVATLTPHGSNPDGLEPASWNIEAENHATARSRAFDLVGEAVGCADFAYRELADNSVSIMDAVCGSRKIASLRMVQPSRRA